VSIEPDFDRVICDLDDAQEGFREADASYEAARHARTAAINKLNAAQKAFDDAVIAVRKGAPWDSNWSPRGSLKGILID